MLWSIGLKRSKRLKSNQSTLITILAISCVITVCKYIYSFGGTDLQTKTMHRWAHHHVPKLSIRVMVMGEADGFLNWAHILGQDMNGTYVSYLYASYDTMLDKCDYLNHPGFDCDTQFIPNTTWTQGRNLMAANTMKKELQEGISYGWWLFMDEDIILNCGGAESQLCVKQSLKFIVSEEIPKTITTIAAAGQYPWSGFVSVSTVDAIFAAFRRQFVPYLLPYALPMKDSSEWNSQAANFCVVKTCFPGSVLILPHTGYTNPQHRPYVRGLDDADIHKTIEQNFCNVPGFCPCEGLHNYGHNQDMVTNGNLSIVGQNIQHRLDECQPLLNRFDEWSGGLMEASDQQSTIV